MQKKLTTDISYIRVSELCRAMDDFLTVGVRIPNGKVQIFSGDCVCVRVHACVPA